MNSKESTYVRKEPRNLKRVPNPQSTQDREDQEYEKEDQVIKRPMINL